jgi:hypothetical protein
LSHPDSAAPAPPHEPKRPTLLATAMFTLWPAILSLPMLAGKWLASPWSDQYSAGLPFLTWGAEWWKRTGHIPLWNPMLFGGIPYVAAGHGDIFYPTWLLRLVIPFTAAGDISFFVHYVLAGLFTYLLVRRLGVSWAGALVAGLAFQLSGLIASYPSPGHDGKLFASTALPLAFLALVLAVRERRWIGYPLLSLAIALTLFGHFIMAYYLVIAAGLFGLYLAFGESDGSALPERVGRLGLALAAVLLGFGIAAVQVLPFFSYIPFSPRAESYGGFAASASYAIPWDHVPEFFLKNFVGSVSSYWGSNPLKLHSEYLGLPVIALAVLGVFARERRRLVLWLGGLGLLYLLISMGASTPFYQLWWAVMPLVKKTRAPGMAFFVVTLVTAIFAGLGAERAARNETRRAALPLVVTGVAVALLAATGVLGQFAEGLARAAQQDTGRSTTSAVLSDQSAILWGALSSGLALAAVGAVVLVARRGLLPGRQVVFLLALIVGADLWLNARHFWNYTRPYGRDAVIDRLAATPPPYRVLDLGILAPGGGYPGSSLMAFDVPQVLGYHGNELRFYDELLGGKNVWTNLFSRLQLWDLLAVRYAVAPAGALRGDSLPGYHSILDATTSGGESVRLFERNAPVKYARVVPAAIQADSAAVVPLLMDPRLDYSRLVLFTRDQPVTPATVTQMPDSSPSRASVTAWQPGRMTVTMDPAPASPGYLLVSENWYPDWRASVDGRAATVLRGDYSFITVPVPAGARTVELAFRSTAFEWGRRVTFVSLALLALAFLAPLVARRRRDA